MNYLQPFAALLFAFVAGLWVRDAWRTRKPAYGLSQTWNGKGNPPDVGFTATSKRHAPPPIKDV